MNITIKNIYGASTRTNAEGKTFTTIATQSLIPAQTTILGQGEDQLALVNVVVTSLADSIKELMTQHPEHDHRLVATDALKDIEMTVPLRGNLRPDKDPERSLYWANV